MMLKLSPKKLSFSVPKPLVQELTCKRPTHQLVLVGSDCCENCLWKDECSKFFRLQIEQGGRVVFLLYDVHPWLVLMH